MSNCQLGACSLELFSFFIFLAKLRPGYSARDYLNLTPDLAPPSRD